MDDNRPLADWLRGFQGIDDPETMLKDLPDPSRTRAGLGALVEGNLGRLTFETENAAFDKLLHDLAPAALKGPEND